MPRIGCNWRKWFHIKKVRSRWYPTVTMINSNYADDIVLLDNTSPSRILTALLIASSNANANKTNFMSFKEKETIFTLKLVNQFIYLGSNFSSTKRDVNIHLAKAWTTIGGLSIIWKSDLCYIYIYIYIYYFFKIILNQLFLETW